MLSATRKEKVAGVDDGVQMEILASWPWCSLLWEEDEDVEEVEVAPFHGSGGRVGGHGDSGGGRQVRR